MGEGSSYFQPFFANTLGIKFDNGGGIFSNIWINTQKSPVFYGDV
jgi:hypothetical protein